MIDPRPRPTRAPRARAAARRPGWPAPRSRTLFVRRREVRSTGTRHRPAVAALKQPVAFRKKATCAVLRTLLTPVADAEPSTASFRNQAELERMRDAVTSRTAGVRRRP